MKINDTNFPLIPVLLIFILAYIFLAVRPLEKKLDLKPEWTISVSEQTAEPNGDSRKLFAFKTETAMGYYTPDGKIVSFIPLEKKSTISADFWTVYDRDAENTPFFTPQNVQSGTLDKAGFPFFTANGLFVFHPGGASFSCHDTQGKTLWVHENYAPITAFDSSSAGCAAGYADGNLICLDKEGNVCADFYPGGSDTQIIFGAALSENGKYCASVSGLHKQRIVVVEIENDNTKIIYHEYLKDEFTEQTLVDFSSDGKYAFFNTKSGLISVLINERRSFFIPFKGKILNIAEFGSDDIFYVLDKKDSTYTVTVLCSGRYNKGSFSFEASSAFLQAGSGSVYVGRDNRISKMSLNFN